MSTFTCIACHVAFNDAELQRVHYKSDWHRYNLKRKVLSMPPVSAATFQEKVLQHQSQAASKETKDGISGFSCKLCSKKFGTHNAFNNHILSRRHKNLEKAHLRNVRDNASMPTSEVEGAGDYLEAMQHEEKAIAKALTEAKADISQPKILTKEDNNHEKRRGFKGGDNPRLRWLRKQVEALDDEEMWEDFSEEEMEEDLFEAVKKDEDADIASVSSEQSFQKIIHPNECLFCLKPSKDVSENLIHMSSKHSFFIPDIEYINDLEGLVSYLGEKVGVGNVCLKCNEKGKAFYSLDAVQKHMIDKGHCQMMFEGNDVLEYADYYNYDEILDSDDDSDNAKDDDSLELVLPSGGSIGHRSLWRYYKQKFPTVQRPNQTSGKKSMDQIVAQYRSAGWKVQKVTAAARKDVAFVQKLKSKYQINLSIRNNKTQMKHFRSQIGMNAG